MKTLANAVDLLNLALFTLLALAAFWEWRAGRGRAGLWAALAFGALAVVVDAGRIVAEEPEGRLEVVAERALIAILVLFPYLLYRFTTAFTPPTRRLERFTGVMTIVVVVATFAVPEFPDEGEPRPAAFVAYLVAFLVHWTVLSALTAVRLWRGGRGQPTVARRRMQLLSGAAAALTVALFLAAASPREGSAVDLAVSLLASVSAVAFLIGLRPPAVLRILWRRPEQERLQAAVADLMRATTEEEVVDRVLPPMAAMVGARAVAFYGEDDRLIGEHGASPSALPPPSAETASTTDEDVLRLDVPPGRLVIRTSAYAPYFGDDEIRLLRTLAALTGIALDRARLFAQERDARLALERADELKTNFVALAAHELRAPVATAYGLAKTLEARTQLGAAEREEIETALHDQVVRLASLVEQLLDLSRLDAEAVTIEPVRVSVRARLAEIVSAVAREHAADVQVEVPRDLEAAIDPSALERIVSNLIVNALRHGDPPVTLRAERSDGDLRVTVEDCGPGVPPDLVPELFERFTRSADSAAMHRGTGLGLAIARSYAHAHGGDLRYEPAQPSGARFEVVLPTGSSRRADE